MRSFITKILTILIPCLLLHHPFAHAEKMTLDEELFLAVRSLNYVKAKHLLEAGANVNAVGDTGLTPLLVMGGKTCGFKKLTCDRRFELIVRVASLLVENGADVNVKNKYGWSVINLAIRAGNKELVKLLAQRGASLEDCDSRTVLAAVEKNDCELLKIISELGLSLNTSQDIEYRISKSPLGMAFMVENPADMVQCLLDLGANPAAVDKYGQNALMYASSFRDVRPLKVILAKHKNIDVNLADNDGSTALQNAAENACTENVKILLAAGADIDIKDIFGYTPLLLALGDSIRYRYRASDYYDTALLLIEHGADINAKDQAGRSVMNNAIRFGNKDLVKLLVQKGASLEGCDSNTVLPAVNRKDCEFLEMISELGLSLNKSSVSEGTHFASPLEHALSLEDSADIVQCLLDLGVDPGEVNQNNQNALMQAALIEDVKPLKVILAKAKDIDINLADDRGNTALHNAVREGRIENVKVLLEAGADFSLKDGNGLSPLLLISKKRDGVRTEYCNTARLLIEYGADINEKDQYGQSVINNAIRSGNKELVKLLAQKGALLEDCDAFTVQSAVQKNDCELLKIISELGLSLKKSSNPEHAYLQSPLEVAFASDNSAGMVQCLLDLGVGVDPDAVDRNGEIVWFDVLNRDSRPLKAVLASGASIDINMADKEGYTAFHVAALRGYVGNMKVLMAAGADLNIKNNHGETPLLSIVKHSEKFRTENSFKVAQLLIENGADINAKDQKGWSAINYAIRAGNKELVKVLAQNGASVEDCDAETVLAAVYKKDCELLDS